MRPIFPHHELSTLAVNMLDPLRYLYCLVKSSPYLWLSSHSNLDATGQTLNKLPRLLCLEGGLESYMTRQLCESRLILITNIRSC